MQFLCGQCRRVFTSRDEATVACPNCGELIRPTHGGGDGRELIRMLRADQTERGFAAHARKMIARRVAVACESCGRRLSLAMRRSGQTVRCPSCRSPVQVPKLDAADEQELQRLMERLATRPREDLDVVSSADDEQSAPVAPRLTGAGKPDGLPGPGGPRADGRQRGRGEVTAASENPVDALAEDPLADDASAKDVLADDVLADDVLEDIAAWASAAGRPRRRRRESAPLIGVVVAVLGVAGLIWLGWFIHHRRSVADVPPETPAEVNPQAVERSRETPEWDRPVELPWRPAAEDPPAVAPGAAGENPPEGGARTRVAPRAGERDERWRLFD